MRISFHLEPDDIERFHVALLRSRRLVDCADEIDLIDAAKQSLDSVCVSKLPGYVRSRLVHVQRLIVMLEDEAWSLAAPERIDALSLLVYFSDPDDLIPDTIDVIGLLDDAIMLEMMARHFRPVFRAYSDFCTFRSGLMDGEVADRRVVAARLAVRRGALHQRMRRQFVRRELVPAND